MPKSKGTCVRILLINSLLSAFALQLRRRPPQRGNVFSEGALEMPYANGSAQ